MTNYLIRTGKDGMVTDLVELGEEEHESCLSDKCYDCEQLEAALLAIIQSQNEKLRQMESRIRRLESPVAKRNLAIMGLGSACGGLIIEPATQII